MLFFKKIFLMVNYRFLKLVWHWEAEADAIIMLDCEQTKLFLRTLNRLNDNARPHILAIKRHFCGNLMPNKTSKHLNNRSQLKKSCVEFSRIDIGCVNSFRKRWQKRAKNWQIVCCDLRLLWKNIIWLEFVHS